MSDPCSDTRVRVRVTPRAARNQVRPGEDGRLEVRVTVPAEGGKANEAVRRELARHFGIAKSRVVLVSGARGRRKAYRIA